MLMLFANQAAVAIENARLFEETELRMAELEALNRSPPRCASAKHSRKCFLCSWTRFSTY